MLRVWWAESEQYGVLTHAGSGVVISCIYDHGNFLRGSIGEFFCYNRPLTDVEVLQNYNSTKGKYGL